MSLPCFCSDIKGQSCPKCRPTNKDIPIECDLVKTKETKSHLFDKITIQKSVCDGKGYWLGPPYDNDWDVDLVRINCPGCKNCKPKGW